MKSINLTDKTPEQLLNLYSDVLAELNRREIVRTYNSPVGDYAEWLVAKTFGLELENNSQKGYDAINPKTRRKYQIKSRWEREDKPSIRTRQLSPIRDFDEDPFDYLIVVIFDKQFGVKEAYKIPYSEVKGKKNSHVNGLQVIAMGKWLKPEWNITDRF